ncbi:unnamed protein product (macronuclear) [Paramecium tetraurelia]|uniref:Uncharacterized protein n=1 Tax=Paramecium tetraurelia TaxID=5888 RepID=A0C0K6_PARTE|nr:uncharacterized protein GSPATT00006176001 [Paramecium tetraurelia]CAK64323.1 unnamed protein product [Paramecium tetraurelia]|eukprot:XP_001431721.1 hypothetical protein (macronuclear) [Paramecium tetraurelia strain d4-2]
MSRSNLSSPQQRKVQLNQVGIDRKFRLKRLTNSLKENQCTYLLFGFKADERQENLYIKEFQRQIQNTHSLGVMNIADLWSNKQINRFIEIQNFSKDKFLLSQLSKQRIRIKMEKQELPVQLHYEKIKGQKLSLQEILDKANKEHYENSDLKSRIRKLITQRVHSENI